MSLTSNFKYHSSAISFIRLNSSHCNFCVWTIKWQCCRSNVTLFQIANKHMQLFISTFRNLCVLVCVCLCSWLELWNQRKVVAGFGFHKCLVEQLCTLFTGIALFDSHSSVSIYLRSRRFAECQPLNMNLPLYLN